MRGAGRARAHRPGGAGALHADPVAASFAMRWPAARSTSTTASCPASRARRPYCAGARARRQADRRHRALRDAPTSTKARSSSRTSARVDHALSRREMHRRRPRRRMRGAGARGALARRAPRADERPQDRRVPLSSLAHARLAPTSRPARQHRPTTSRRSSTRRCSEATSTKLMAVWSDDDDIVCVHPGRAARGRRRARSARRSRRSSPTARIHAAGRHRCAALVSHRRAVHNVLERVDDPERRGRAAGPGSSPPTSTSRPRRAGAWWRTTPARARAHEPRRARRSAVHAALMAAAPDVSALRAPRWLPGGNAQTIWPALFARRLAGVAPAYRRERWDTPDGDFVDVDFVDAAAAHGAAAGAVPRPRRLVAQPLCARPSRTGRSDAAGASRCRTSAAARASSTCAPRAYHSGDYEEVGWMLDAPARAQPRRRCIAVGVSLGGNALLRWAEEAGDSAARRACARGRGLRRRSTWPPAARAIGRGFNRLVYTRMFLRTMKPKALAKLAQHPGLFDRDAAAGGARPVRVRQRLHRAAARLSRHRRLLGARARPSRTWQRIRMPALVLNARNDPFVPAASLPRRTRSAATSRCGSRRTAATSAFRAARFPGHVHDPARAVMGWLRQHA